MKRKSIDIEYGDKALTLSERNKEDADFSALQEKCRAYKFKFIQENIVDEDNKLSMMLAEMRHVYTGMEIGQYIFSSEEEQYKIVWDSAKIENPNLTLDEVKEIVPKEELKKLMRIITGLETPEDDKKKVTEKR